MRSEKTKTVLVYIAGNIRRLRDKKQLTQEKLAEISDLETRFLQSIERGTANLSVDVLVSLADALGVSPTALFRPSKVATPKPGRPPKKRKRKK